MSITTRRFQPEDADALDRLNFRLKEGGSRDRVYPEDLNGSQRAGDHGPVSTKLWVAAGQTEIHGGVWLKEHDFWAAGRELRAGWIKYPVAESVVNRKYGGVPGAMIFSLVRRHPDLMAIGMGGHNRPIAQLLSAMGWSGYTIPLYMYVVNPLNLLKECSFLRNTKGKLLLNRFLAYSGAAWLGTKLLMAVRRALKMRFLENYSIEPVERFDRWADIVWEQAKNNYAFSSVRNAEMLYELYPSKYRSLNILRISNEKGDLGWACVARYSDKSDTASRFGNSVVGVIFDCFGRPEDAVTVLAAATDYLIRAKVDVILLNISHSAWGKALRSLGYITWNGNYAFYSSPVLTKKLNFDHQLLQKTFLTVADSHTPEMLRVHLRPAVATSGY